MYSLLKRKIRLYPIVSVIVAGLVSGILMFESGMIYAPTAAPALVSSATQKQTTQPASVEQGQSAEVSTDSTHEDPTAVDTASPKETPRYRRSNIRRPDTHGPGAAHPLRPANDRIHWRNDHAHRARGL